MTLSGGGSATITPKGSSDDGATYATISRIGAQTSNGAYGATMVPYLTNFYVAVTGVTGTVNVSEACSAAFSSGASLVGTVSCTLSSQTCNTTTVANATGVCQGTVDADLTTATGGVYAPQWSTTNKYFVIRAAATVTGDVYVDYSCP